MRHRVALLLMALVALSAATAAGCGGSSSSTGSSKAAEEANSGTQTHAVAAFRIPLKEAPVRNEAELKTKQPGLVGAEPKPIIPDSPPPKTLVLQDLIQGIGHLATDGSKVTIQYVGVDYKSGKKIESSWDEGKPVTFTLGDGTMIEGLEEGIVEMEVGDRREMVIPPALAQGGRPAEKIPSHSTSVFVVDLLAVQ